VNWFRVKLRAVISFVPCVRMFYAFWGLCFVFLGLVTERSIISFGYDDFALASKSGDNDLFL